MKNVERRANTVSAVLQASLQALETVGYNRLRTIDVARRSGMSEGILFRYFPTKYELVRASLEIALNRHVERLTEEFAAMAQSDHGSLIRMLWRLLSNPELLWTYELFAAAHSDEKLQATIKPVLDAHTKTVDDASIAVLTNRLGNDPSEVRRAINLVTWSMQGLVLRDMGRGDSGAQEPLIGFLRRIAETVYPQTPETNRAQL